MSDIVYEIVEAYGTLSVSESGWRKELNLVSFNHLDPKYDLREWSPDRRKMSRGIRLSKEEAEKLYILLQEHFT